MLGRRTKSFVPITSKALQPDQVDPKTVLTSVNRSKAKQKQNYDKSSKILKRNARSTWKNLETSKSPQKVR